MSKYRGKSTPKQQISSANDIKEERKFFKIAILVTVVLLVIIYFAFR
jgi:hypothetical protein